MMVVRMVALLDVQMADGKVEKKAVRRVDAMVVTKVLLMVFLMVVG